MGLISHEPLTNISTVAAGSTVTIGVPVGGPSYDKFTLNYAGVTLAQLLNIQLRLNGNIAWDLINGVDLDDMNTFYGVQDTAGFLSLNMAMPWLAEGNRDAVFTSLGTKDLQSCELVFDVDGAAAAPVITANALVGEIEPTGFIRKIKRNTINAGSAGLITVDNLPLGPNLAALHWKKADVDDVEILVDNRKVIDGSKAQLHEAMLRAGRAPVAARFTHWDFLLRGRIEDALVTYLPSQARHIQLRQLLTLGTSGSAPYYAEYINTVLGI